MGGPRVSSYVHALLVETWKDSLKTGKGMQAKQVLIAAKDKLDREAESQIELPSLRKAQLILADARKRWELARKSAGVLKEHEKSWDAPWLEDDPWCSGSLRNYEIPPDALPTVLRVWKLCLATEREFTIRDARWVARLSATVKDVVKLSYWARRYASSELVCQVSNQRFDSSALDAYLVMGSWELPTARWVGKLGMVASTSSYALPDMREPLNLGHFASSHAVNDAERSAWAWYVGAEDELEEFGPELNDLPSLDSFDITEEAKFVYIYWLSYLRDGPRWRSLTKQEQSSVFQELRRWITQHPWSRMENLPSDLVIADRRYPGGVITKLPDLAPTDILEKVGYYVEHLPTLPRGASKRVHIHRGGDKQVSLRSHIVTKEGPKSQKKAKKRK